MIGFRNSHITLLMYILTAINEQSNATLDALFRYGLAHLQYGKRVVSSASIYIEGENNA